MSGKWTPVAMRMRKHQPFSIAKWSGELLADGRYRVSFSQTASAVYCPLTKKWFINSKSQRAKWLRNHFADHVIDDGFLTVWVYGYAEYIRRKLTR